MPVKALWEIFMARRAGKKLVPLAAVPDTLLGRGPLHAHRTPPQHSLPWMHTQEVLPKLHLPMLQQMGSTHLMQGTSAMVASGIASSSGGREQPPKEHLSRHPLGYIEGRRPHLRVLLLMTRKVRSGACARAAGKEPLKLLKDRRTLTRELLATLGYPSTHSSGNTLRWLPFTSSVSRFAAMPSALGMLPATFMRALSLPFAK